jgi:hypothetical protein
MEELFLQHDVEVPKWVKILSPAFFSAGMKQFILVGHNDCMKK